MSGSGTARARGSAAPGFERVVEAFERNFAERGELGAAFAAVVDGELVVDLWGGIADSREERAWQENTLVGVFSGSKGLVATCMALLVERGQLALDVPVRDYWPEFGVEGKERILVGDVLTHEAGLPGLDTPVTVEEATDALRMAQLVAAQRPSSAPGAGPRYHAMTFGWICGELVRRVDGRSVGRFLHEEVAEPLGLEVWIGLPASRQEDVAFLERGPGFVREQSEIVLDREADPLAWSIWSNPPRFSDGELAANLRVWRAAEVPATSGIVAARSLARLYGCLARGGEIDGVRLLKSETLDRMRGRLARGEDPYLGEVAFAAGFEVQTPKMPLGPAEDAFGHAGAGGSVHGAWPGLRTGFSYAPNLLDSVGEADPRAVTLLDALHDAVISREARR
ncbi:MAG TPA: serine hydrolase domain-containing protein [Solirubrobacterales bacterium]|nr:serine hydrolase domain-containing protein [Solirubrobacterales bacterium]